MAAQAHIDNLEGDAEVAFLEALKKAATCYMKALLLASDRRVREASPQTAVFILPDCTVMKHCDRYLIVAATRDKLDAVLKRYKLWNCTITRLRARP